MVVTVEGVEHGLVLGIVPELTLAILIELALNGGGCPETMCLVVTVDGLAARNRSGSGCLPMTSFAPLSLASTSESCHPPDRSATGPDRQTAVITCQPDSCQSRFGRRPLGASPSRRRPDRLLDDGTRHR